MTGIDYAYLIRRTRAACIRAGFDVEDPEIGSAVGFAIAEALAAFATETRGKLVTACIAKAMRMCCAAVAERFESYADEPSSDDVRTSWSLPLTAFADAETKRFACVPWSLLDLAAFDFGVPLLNKRDDHYTFDEWPVGAVAVSTETFDRLLADERRNP